jgi:hypothetical protein
VIGIDAFLCFVAIHVFLKLFHVKT